MNIAIIGMGYVGVSTAVSFATWGHHVIGVDIDADKINSLQAGIPPFYEDGLDHQLQQFRHTGNLAFTTDLNEAIDQSRILFITVGTPSDAEGAADLSAVRGVARQIGGLMRAYTVVVVKSTVPVGTTDEVNSIIRAELAKRGLQIPFDVAANPEFLREGRALIDALRPDRIVVGCQSPRALSWIHRLYERVESPLLCTTPRNAEMIKYASNAFLATKISFINEVARLCDQVGADIVDVARGMGMDSRIGREFLQAGIGYGGSCFPKDVRALIHLAHDYDLEMSILEKVQEVNDTQVSWFISKVQEKLANLRGKRIALLGLTFKPHTDDLREAPSLRVIPELLQRGATVCAYDPKGMEGVCSLHPAVHGNNSPLSAVQGADAIVLLTEWPEILGMDWGQARELCKGTLLFDARNALDPKRMEELGFDYVGIGRFG
jgi:UDPglucose 6-dehydrogenase